MNKRFSVGIALLGTVAAIFLGCRSPQSQAPIRPASAETPKTFSDFQAQAAKFNSTLSLPHFETTPEAIRTSVSNTMALATADYDRVGRLQAHEVTFANTVRALDDIGYRAGLTASRIWLIKETSEDPKMRETGTEMMKVFQEWAVSQEYREDVYNAIQAFAKTNPRLSDEDKKLFDETLRDYRRAGLHLPKAERQEIESLRKELTRLTTDFDTHITEAKREVKFTTAQLEGVPESFLKTTNTGENEHTVLANVTWHYLSVLDNCRREDTRKALFMARSTLAKEKNLPLLREILLLRDNIAKRLGYPTWADYQIEPRMAKTAKTARDFLVNLAEGLQPKFDQEISALRELKVRETGDANATVHIWDWRYFSNLLKKEKYDIDAEALRVYFPLGKTLQGMFNIYEHIFGLKIHSVEPPYRWTQDLPLYVVTDSQNGEPLGAFYLDLYPREGKYSHFAQFGLIDGKRLPDGKYQRPTVSLVCNFPPPTAERPSLLSHNEVETLFHEFGHVLHSILTRAKYSRFSGTSVPRDFVEAPSQMLEYWVWDKKVLDGFAAHYENPAKKIPPAVLEKLKEAKLATEGLHYRRQASFGLVDLTLHMQVQAGTEVDIHKLSNRILAQIFLPEPDEAAFIAYFGHLTGYDAGYYGYAWSDAIAADMATVFENAPDGYFDKKIGMRLRKEIYEPGDSRDVNISIRRFLGRERSLEPFFKQLGIGSAQAKN